MGPRTIATVSTIIALFAVLLAGVTIRRDASRGAEADRHVPELGEQMNALARRFGMLWFAARNGNQELAGYELHEMEELVESIAAFPRAKNGVDVGVMVEGLAKTCFPQLEAAVAAGEVQAFERAYRDTMDACNACHRVAGYPFIRIQIPSAPPVPNRAW